jgi:hypothetical protein
MYAFELNSFSLLMRGWHVNDLIGYTLYRPD